MSTFCRKCDSRFSCPDCKARQRDVDGFLKTFSLDALTVIRYHNWRALPESAGIYFTLDPDREVLYIGQSQNLLHRWGDNFRRQYNTGAVSIGFLLVDRDKLWRLCLERTLIKKFSPRMAGVLKIPGPKLGLKRGQRKAARLEALEAEGFTVQSEILDSLFANEK